MKFDLPAYNDLDFSPIPSQPINMLAWRSAHAAIVSKIIQGSGGPDNLESTESGLRFIRYLLSISGSASQGIIPNLKNMELIQEIAREFIRQCGSSATALAVLARVTEPD